jgi:hypothetical protein
MNEEMTRSTLTYNWMSSVVINNPRILNFTHNILFNNLHVPRMLAVCIHIFYGTVSWVLGFSITYGKYLQASLEVDTKLTTMLGELITARMCWIYNDKIKKNKKLFHIFLSKRFSGDINIFLKSTLSIG